MKRAIDAGLGVPRTDEVWLAIPDPDVDEVRRARDRMRAYLGRYGHQSMQGWNDVSLWEFEELHEAVSSIVRAENESIEKS